MGANMAGKVGQGAFLHGLPECGSAGAAVINSPKGAHVSHVHVFEGNTFPVLSIVLDASGAAVSVDLCHSGRNWRSGAAM